MAQVRTAVSLCMNCRYRGGCQFEHQAIRPMLHCEAHEAMGAAVNTVTGHVRIARTASAPYGLCTTCDHRAHCSLRSRERLVLQCDHFE
ncbi:MAG: hypothetical protein QY325_02445 [Flavobacteriales bacterium]|nr:MAG: hypothetical protein QY325_02445 [Flavobacteriales bacterium]